MPAYGLAEWFAYNYFFVTTPYSFDRRENASGAIRTSERYSVRSVGGGFPFPSITFRPEEDALGVVVHARGGVHRRVSLIENGAFLVPLGDAVDAIVGFVEEVISRLQHFGVRDTLLQQEWQRVRRLDPQQIDFCQAAAVVGLDPFNLESLDRDRILALGDLGLTQSLLLQLLSATDVVSAQDGAKWVKGAFGELSTPRVVSSEPEQLAAVMGGSADWSRGISQRPWHLGYGRAEKLRVLLDLEPTTAVDIEQFVDIRRSAHAAPGRLDALVDATTDSPVCVVGSNRPSDTRRFVAARTLGRALFTEATGPQVVWHGQDNLYRPERAFAAEFLAPAQGVAQLLAGDYSPRSRRRAASHFGVSKLLIDHQVRNQILAA